MQKESGLSEIPKLKYVKRGIDSFTYRIIYYLIDLIYILILLIYIYNRTTGYNSNLMFMTFDQMEVRPLACWKYFFILPVQ